MALKCVRVNAVVIKIIFVRLLALAANLAAHRSAIFQPFGTFAMFYITTIRAGSFLVGVVFISYIYCFTQ